MKKIPILILLLSLSVIRCSFPGRHSEDEIRKSLYGTNWYLQKIYNAGGDIEIKKSIAFISFDAEKNSVSGNGGCNHFGGKCVIEGRKITLKDIHSTEMYCVDFHSQEEIFFRHLLDINRFDIKEGNLLLYRDAGLLLEFRK